MVKELIKKLSEKNIIACVFLLWISMGCIITTISSIESIKKAIASPNRIEAWQQDYDINYNFTKNAFGKGGLIDLNGYISRLMGQTVLNETVRLENNHLISLEEPADISSMEENIAELSSLQSLADDIDCEFLYVSAPAKNILVTEDLLPNGLEDNANENRELFFSMLSEASIEYLDVCDVFRNNNVNGLDYYYRTDHHWTPECGLMVARHLVESWGGDAEMLQIESFTVENYSRWHLGSLGQRVGQYFGGSADDMHYIYPDYATNFVNITTGETGNFQEIFTDTSVLLERDYSQRLVYDTLYGKAGGQHIRNSNVENGLKIYFISDSMGSVIVPYLSLVCEEVVWGGLSEEEIRSFQPDVIIVVQISSHIGI